jgi:hypothetical protein
MATVSERQNAIINGTSRINGFVIPNYNPIKNYYHGSTPNIEKVEYKQDSTIVATLSFTYIDPVLSSSPRINEVIKL